MRKAVTILVLLMATLTVRQMPYRLYADMPLVGEIQTEQFVICEKDECPKLDELRPKLKNPLLEMGIRIPKTPVKKEEKEK
ncbi:MAG: hypothetical protein D6726_03500 [Nitrospirae bacterium]|nr:MAG: hypothetical protein D6726_03500 [Nitrospirota bacterium]